MVLVDLGWRIRRVWSPEWWADAAAAMEKLHAVLVRDLAADRTATLARSAEEAVAEAVSGGAAQEAGAERPDVFPRDASEDGPREDGHDRRDDVGSLIAEPRRTAVLPRPSRDLEAIYAELSPAPPPDIASPPPPVSRPAPEPAEAAPISAVEAAAAARFRPADLEGCGLAVEPGRFYEPSYRRALAALVAHVVVCEGPLYEDVLVRRIARAHGLGRAGRTVRETILEAVDPGCARSEEDGQGVIWKAGEGPRPFVPFRPSPDGVRGHSEVPLAELAGLALSLRGGRTDDAEVVRAMAARLGLSRLEGATRARFSRAAALAASRIGDAAEEGRGT